MVVVYDVLLHGHDIQYFLTFRDIIFSYLWIFWRTPLIRPKTIFNLIQPLSVSIQCTVWWGHTWRFGASFSLFRGLVMPIVFAGSRGFQAGIRLATGGNSTEIETPAVTLIDIIII